MLAKILLLLLYKFLFIYLRITQRVMIHEKFFFFSHIQGLTIINYIFFNIYILSYKLQILEFNIYKFLLLSLFSILCIVSSFYYIRTNIVNCLRRAKKYN